MGISTNVILKGHITPDQIAKYIKENIYKDVTIDDKCYVPECMPYMNHLVREFYDDSNMPTMWAGYIHFVSEKNNPRDLFYFYANYNSYENLEFYSKYNLEDSVKCEKTVLRLSYDEEAIEIMKGIVSEFGGWIDENDHDNELYYFVNKGEKV